MTVSNKDGRRILVLDAHKPTTSYHQRLGVVSRRGPYDGDTLSGLERGSERAKVDRKASVHSACEALQTQGQHRPADVTISRVVARHRMPNMARGHRRGLLKELGMRNRAIVNP